MKTVTKTTKAGLARAAAEHDRAVQSLRNAERSFQIADSERDDARRAELETRRPLLAHTACLATQTAKIEAELAAKRAAARAEAAAKKGVK